MWPPAGLAGQVWDAALPSRARQLPIDLNEAAKTLGATDVLYRAQRQGYTHWLDKGPRILLALTRSDGRRRATLAHECGHLLVDPLARSAPFREMTSAYQESWTRQVEQMLGPVLCDQLADTIAQQGVERVCDLLSHELLLPSKVARGVRKEWAGDVEGLRAFASHFRLSLTMTMIRLNEVRPTHALLNLRQTPHGQWIAVRSVGAPRWMRGRVQCIFADPDASRFVGERLVQVHVETGSAKVSVPAAVVCAGAGRIVLFDRAGLDPTNNRLDADFVQLTLGGDSDRGGFPAAPQSHPQRPTPPVRGAPRRVRRVPSDDPGLLQWTACVAPEKTAVTADVATTS